MDKLLDNIETHNPQAEKAKAIKTQIIRCNRLFLQ